LWWSFGNVAPVLARTKMADCAWLPWEKSMQKRVASQIRDERCIAEDWCGRATDASSGLVAEVAGCLGRSLLL
jgi:hypothetical protein